MTDAAAEHDVAPGNQRNFTAEALARARIDVQLSVDERVTTNVDLDHSALQRDFDRLAAVRAARAEAAASYFESVADDWDALRSLHIADEDLEQALLGAVEDLNIHTLLDVGTGTGRVLELFAPRIGFGIGIDLSPHGRVHVVEDE